MTTFEQLRYQTATLTKPLLKTIPLPTKERVTFNAYAAAFHSVPDRFIAEVGEPYDKELITAWHECGVINPELRDLLLEMGPDSRCRVLHEKLSMHLNLFPSSFRNGTNGYEAFSVHDLSGSDVELQANHTSAPDTTGVRGRSTSLPTGQNRRYGQ